MLSPIQSRSKSPSSLLTNQPTSAGQSKSGTAAHSIITTVMPERRYHSPTPRPASSLFVPPRQISDSSSSEEDESESTTDELEGLEPEANDGANDGADDDNLGFVQPTNNTSFEPTSSVKSENDVALEPAEMEKVKDTVKEEFQLPSPPPPLTIANNLLTIKKPLPPLDLPPRLKKKTAFSDSFESNSTKIRSGKYKLTKLYEYNYSHYMCRYE